MPCPHNEITIVQRSQRPSAVAAAAYQSGEKLFCEYDQQVKHYPEKRGIPLCRRPRLTTSGAPTKFRTLCPEVHIRPKASTFPVLAFAMFQDIL